MIAYDLAGHGESALPSTKPDLTTLAQQIDRLHEAVGVQRSAIVGFSIGGMINRRFAMDFADSVSALVILNSPHERSPDAQRLVEARAADTGQGGPGANIDETIRRWLTAEFIAANPERVASLRQTVLNNDPVNYAQFRQVLATGVLELIHPDPPIKSPSLVITCENDSGSTPAMSHAIAADIEGAQTLIVPGLQHMGLLERPDLFTKPIASFLDSVLTDSDRLS